MPPTDLNRSMSVSASAINQTPGSPVITCPGPGSGFTVTATLNDDAAQAQVVSDNYTTITVSLLLSSIYNDDIEELQRLLNLLDLLHTDNDISNQLLEWCLEVAATFHRDQAARLIVQTWKEANPMELKLSVLTILFRSPTISDAALVLVKDLFPTLSWLEHIIALVDDDSTAENLLGVKRIIEIYPEQPHRAYQNIYNYIEDQWTIEDYPNVMLYEFIQYQVCRRAPYASTPIWVNNKPIIAPSGLIPKPILANQPIITVTPPVEVTILAQTIGNMVSPPTSTTPSPITSTAPSPITSTAPSPISSTASTPGSALSSPSTPLALLTTPPKITTMSVLPFNRSIVPPSTDIPLVSDLVIPEVLTPIYRAPKTSEEAVKLFTIGLQAQGQSTKVVEELQTQFLDIYSNETYEGKQRFLARAFRLRYMVDLGNNSSLFRLYGPCNVNYNYDFSDETSPCSKYGGCRMLLCVEHETSDADVDPYGRDIDEMGAIGDWFTGNCQYKSCLQRIRARHLAVRRPVTFGGWFGCYCSWDCVRQDIPNYFDTYTSRSTGPDPVLALMIDAFEAAINRIGIQDRLYPVDDADSLAIEEHDADFLTIIA